MNIDEIERKVQEFRDAEMVRIASVLNQVSPAWKQQDVFTQHIVMLERRMARMRRSLMADAESTETVEPEQPAPEAPAPKPLKPGAKKGA
jgi:hypothetical protein